MHTEMLANSKASLPSSSPNVLFSKSSPHFFSPAFVLYNANGPYTPQDFTTAKRKRKQLQTGF